MPSDRTRTSECIADIRTLARPGARTAYSTRRTNTSPFPAHASSFEPLSRRRLRPRVTRGVGGRGAGGVRSRYRDPMIPRARGSHRPMRSRRPAPAAASRPLPRADRLAALLAVGLTAGGCCGSPFDSSPRLADDDSPWWSRLTRSLQCAADLARDAKPEPVSTPPGAMPIAQPVPPDPMLAPGQMRAVRPEGVEASVGPDPIDGNRPCTRVNDDHHGRHVGSSHHAPPR